MDNDYQLDVGYKMTLGGDLLEKKDGFIT